MFLGSSYNWAGDLERAKMWLDQSVGLAREAGDPTALLPAVFMRGATHYYQSEYEQAERCEKEAVALGSSSRDGFFLLFARFFLGLTLGNRGRISEALDTMNTAVELAGRNNNIGVLARIPNCIAWMHAELQDLETAARLNREAAEIARGYGIVEAEANSYVNLIGDYTCTGKSDQALTAIRNAKAAYEHDPWLQWRYLGIRLQANAAERCISVGDLDQAAAHVQTLLENAERTSARKYIAIAHKIRAEIAMKRGDDQTAEAELLTGLEELREFPAPLAGWKIHLALGRLRTRLGQSEAARDSYSQAASIVEHIASNVRDEQMRAAFLNRAIIREILQQATRAAES